ncbi:hypothetical protein JIN84_17435 [Luteolibacter yonseiensis]|uniref:Lipoprotein n=1 Tax=Luteolibacter yonseiensis TaxID=1144680 RepID=A0A934R5L2_9BACT|nr:hypothetical protein [Luteolibacter yonseiensis]MBK1817407.1 hypothetical protein [Luteolibacter yonseiensis]
MKIILATIFTSLLGACSAPVAPTAPDMGPIGDGLKVIGYALIGMAVVITAGRSIR